MILRKIADEATYKIPPRTLIGRTHRCDLTLPWAWISGEHAVIRWSGLCWEIRDLGSRNGTCLNDAPLEVGVWQPLREGDTLQFGRPDTRFRVRGAEPPALYAIAQHDERIVMAEGGMLVLPDPDTPSAMIVQDSSGIWVMEDDAGSHSLLPGEVVRVGEVLFRIYLPDEGAGTTEAHSVIHLTDLTLCFAVSSDEEFVHLVARTRQEEIDLKARVHHYLLLTLARIRQQEAASDIRESEAGWVYIEELARMLRLSLSQINMAVFRARRQLAAAGVDGAATLVERRPSTRQIRIGCTRLEIGGL